MNHLLKEVFEKSEQEIKKRENMDQLPKPDYLKIGLLRDNDMSPYTAPHSPTAYRSITEVLKKRPYKGSFPQSFTEVPEYFRRYNLAPFFEPREFDDYARGVMTIENMIELTASGQPWQLDRDQDVYEIIGIAEEYQKQLHDSNCTAGQNNKAIEAYKVKLHTFLNKMYKARDKIEVRLKGRVQAKSAVDILKRFFRS